MAEVGVVVRNDEDFERAFKRFKKVFERAGVIRHLKKNLYFEKPSEINRRKRNTMKKRGFSTYNKPRY